MSIFVSVCRIRNSEYTLDSRKKNGLNRYRLQTLFPSITDLGYKR
ncbi:Orf23 [Heliothis zea nudivirus]|uniref:Orf23 n=1 Tax=Heliothis zea nudivirus 1 TaxID=3116536 RepID=Q8JKT8_9VIRU|nr:Orf23 [Heliothis zea nudivirus]AAN04318.1 Orf23 [Heliothis zea nudivirus]